MNKTTTSATSKKEIHAASRPEIGPVMPGRDILVQGVDDGVVEANGHLDRARVTVIKRRRR